MNGKLNCPTCQGEGWVCEDHSEEVWDTWHQLNCGAGMPCKCSRAHPDNWTEEERIRIAEIDRQIDEINRKG